MNPAIWLQVLAHRVIERLDALGAALHEQEEPSMTEPSPGHRLTQRGLVVLTALSLLFGLLIGGLVEDHWLGGWPL